MRTTRSLSVVSAVLGGGLMLAGPAAAQTAVDCDEYETLAECPIGGGASGGAQGGSEDAGEVEDEGTTAGGAVSRGSAGGAASLPFTGGEVTLIALAGTAALGGGLVLTMAGRKRTTV